MRGAIAKGLSRARALDVAGDGYAGWLDLGLRATPDDLAATLDTAHRLVRGPVDLSAFAQGWAGARKLSGGWTSDFGALAGLRVAW